MAAHVTSTKVSNAQPMPQYSNLPASVAGFIQQVQNAAKGIYDAAGHKLAGLAGGSSASSASSDASTADASRKAKREQDVEEGLRKHKAKKARREQLDPVFRAQMN